MPYGMTDEFWAKLSPQFRAEWEEMDRKWQPEKLRYSSQAPQNVKVGDYQIENRSDYKFYVWSVDDEIAPDANGEKK